MPSEIHEMGKCINKSAVDRNRRLGYFEGFLNEENESHYRIEGIQRQDLTNNIEKEELMNALSKMKNSKAAGPDGSHVK